MRDMAIMIPAKHRLCTVASRESEMFEALEKGLSDEYTVFHSLKINNVKDNTLYESETDFVIFHRKKGLLCIEAKAGKVYSENETWYYSDGRQMSGEGPFAQANSNKWKLYNYLMDNKAGYYISKCKLMHAVWFPSIDEAYLNRMSLPINCDKKLVLTAEALLSPEKYVSNIMSIDLPNKKETNLTEAEAKQFIGKYLCRNFGIEPSNTLDVELKKQSFFRLLKEQINVLNFMAEQRTAVINGAAGTGKTVIAVRKAVREAEKGDKVLFLCYNKFLKEHLEKTNPHENISYYTIDGFCCKLCNSSIPDYSMMKQVLEEYFFAENFPYTHIVIDEGQDFGISAIENNNIMNYLKDIVTCKTDNGTFFVFYDKLQLVQFNSQMPSFIEEADCKMTLYKNCRNTYNIASTSLSPITDRMPIVCDEIRPASVDENVMMYFGDKDTVSKDIDAIISKLEAKGYRDIVILTTRTESDSVLSAYVNDSHYKKYVFSTCRKFKGLEADAIIMVDIDKDTFDVPDEDDMSNKPNKKHFYVGSSRAKLALCLYSVLDDDECTYVINNYFNTNKRIKKPKRDLCNCLKAYYSAIYEED